MTQFALAFDMGGTTLKAALVSPDGQLRGLRRVDTPHALSPQAAVVFLADLLNQILHEADLSVGDILGIGGSTAAFITADGMVTATAHLTRDWVNFDLGSALHTLLPTHYRFALDTPTPTLGEAYFGAGRGYADFVYVTVSTGIGAGIFANGRYFTGGLGWAGGVGHIIIDEHSPRICAGCGNAGCLETFAATQGVIANAMEVLQAYPNSLLAAHADHLTPKLIFDAAIQSDEAACIVWERVGHALGIGLVNLIDIVAPRRVVIGGGIAQAGELLLAPARAVISARAFPPQLRQTEIVQAELGDLSALYGAAALIFQDLSINPGKEKS